MHFIKGVAKWATIWTALFVGIGLFGSLRKGEPFSVFEPLFVSVLCWPVMAVLVGVFRLHTFIRAVGFSLGRQVVRHPGRSADEGIRQAGEDAAVAAGFKPSPALPPPLPRA